MTLHTITYILDNAATQSQARKMAKLAHNITEETSKVGYLAYHAGLGDAVAADLVGTYTSFATPGGENLGQLTHTLKMPELKSWRAEVKAWAEGDAIAKALPVRASGGGSKASKAVVNVSEITAQLRGMTMDEFGKRCETQGIKATFDRGVVALTIPGVRGAQYFDVQTGAQIAEGEKGDALKLSLLERKGEGKLTFYSTLVSEGKRLTATQKDFVIECAESGWTVPANLTKLLPTA